MAKRTKQNNGSSKPVEEPSQAVDIPSSDAEFEKPDELDNPLRVAILVNSPEIPDGDFQERLMDYVQTMEEVDEFFDSFDSKICIPNEEHIKYEVGSDGLVVIVVDSKQLSGQVIQFIDDYNDKMIARSDN